MNYWQTPEEAGDVASEYRRHHLLQDAGAGNRPSISKPDQPLSHGMRTLRQEA